MYQRTFQIYPYMSDVPFRLVVTALYEHYRAVELLETTGRSLEEGALEKTRRQFIHGLGSRLFAAFSSCRLTDYDASLKPGPQRTELFPGVIRTLDMAALLAQAHQLLGDLAPRLAEKGLKLCDLYEGQSLQFAFMPADPGELPERLFWMRAFGLTANGLLSACVASNATGGEDEACSFSTTL